MPWGLPHWLRSKESAFVAGNAGNTGLILGLGRSLAGQQGQPTLVFLPGKFHGQRSLVGYGPWDHKEPDMTEVNEYTCMHYAYLLFCFSSVCVCVCMCASCHPCTNSGTMRTPTDIDV